MVKSLNIFCDDLDQYAKSQIEVLKNHEAFEDANIAIMPDAHAGKVCPIGFTAITPKSNPIMINIVGVDIGCGVSVFHITKPKRGFNWLQLDGIINGFINDSSTIKQEIPIDTGAFHCFKAIHKNKFYGDIGTLGSGNHFIEIDVSNNRDYYLIIHSGSRYLGATINEYYINQAKECDTLFNRNNPYELTCIYSTELKQYYIEDVNFAIDYAKYNRFAIATLICKGIKSSIITEDTINSTHNFLWSAPKYNKFCKGAINSISGNVVIPINAAEGTIIGTAKNNSDYNNCAPHGSGRIAKRVDITTNHTVSEYKKSMKEVYSSTINAKTLDEAPFAYRSYSDIKEYLSATVDVTEILKPIYNFKNGSK